MDGRNLNLQGYEEGYFVGPTLFDEVTASMDIYKDEIFGPVLSVVRVDTYDQALKLVNEHEYGNGSTIYTSDGEISRNFTSKCEIGMVGINVPIPVPMAFHSFGGWKSSLFGDHAMHGTEGIHFFTKLKTVTSRWPKSIKKWSRICHTDKLKMNILITGCAVLLDLVYANIFLNLKTTMLLVLII